VLGERFHGKPLAYLDNAATTQKPRTVIERLSRFYSEENANVQRGVYALSERAGAAYEGARATVQRFLNAALPEEIVFVRGTTEAIKSVDTVVQRVPGDTMSSEPQRRSSSCRR
jgi:cysteine desulfurase / selenocysteine lyase